MTAATLVIADSGSIAPSDGIGRTLTPLRAEVPEPAAKPKHCLPPERIKDAKRFAKARDDSVGFALLDECGRLVGFHRNRVYTSASVVKVMLLTAYLRRDGVSDDELTGDERDMLGAMITMSDNGAADQVFAIVGEQGLNDVADVAGMRNFVSSPSWGGSGITAADQAAFLGKLERYVPKRHEGYVMKLLASIIPEQRWGIADVAPKDWNLHFKGGWYLDPEGWRVNQVATLRAHGRSFGLAVLSDENASFEYGRETIAGVAKRLMAGYRD